MASETDVSELNFIERLIGSRNRDLSLFLPIILGFANSSSANNPAQDSTNPDQETTDASAPRESRDRIILINPLTQSMVVMEGSSSSLDSLMRDLQNKDGPPPASKASIEALPSVEIGEGEDGECAVCLEEWEVAGMVKEMPCKHRFHGECIEKWLGIHGSCPVCRYNMPVDDEDLMKKSSSGGDGGEGRERRREIWVSFSFNSDRRDDNSDRTVSSENTDTSSGPPRPDQEMEN